MSEQLAVLIKKMDQQSEQLQQLTKQSEHVDGVIHRLDEMLRMDLDSVKSTMHGHLEDVESSFSALKMAQEELGERHKALKAELRDELFYELSVAMESTLRPTALPFVPSTGSLGDGGGVTPSGSASHGADGAGWDGFTPGSGAGSAGEVAADADVTSEERDSTLTHGGRSATVTTASVQKPAPFDGNLTWDAYHTQFEMLARINCWSDADKAGYLAISLRGPAATVLTNLPPDQRQNYATLTAALQSRFGTAHQTELNRVKLKVRTHRWEETLPELAEDIEQLVRLAYPDAAESMVGVLTKDQFMDSIPEEDM